MKGSKGAAVIFFIVLTTAIFVGTVLFLQKNHAGPMQLPNFASNISKLIFSDNDNDGDDNVNSLVGEQPAMPVGSKPSVSVGPDITLDVPKKITLTGTATDPDGGNISYYWVKVKGADAKIVSPRSEVTDITGLKNGKYSFLLIATDETGLKSADGVFVQVGPVINYDDVVVQLPAPEIPLPKNPLTKNKPSKTQPTKIVSTPKEPLPNVAPTANAGEDQTITLPTNSANLVGAGSDADGAIVSYFWSKVSGGSATIATPTSSATSISNLSRGTYVFRLVVTDNKGLTAKSEVTILVNAQELAPVSSSSHTPEDVSSHTTANSCWIIISNKVYNVTQFLNSHPGGVATITPFCGGDATVAFHTHGHDGGNDHTTYAYSLLPPYFIGDLTTSVPIPNVPPTVDPGVDKIITLPVNTVTLDGQGLDSDGQIIKYSWVKISGGVATISSPSSAVTTITNLAEGTYSFRLTVKDNSGATAGASVSVIVLPQQINSIPIADPGADQAISLPTSSVTLSGSGYDSDGSVASYAWTKISGGTANIVSPNSDTTIVTGLAQGTYVFQLEVTDDLGAIGVANVTINVNSSSVNNPPAANAGTDQTITVPTSSASLSGSGYDSDGTIASYSWTKISGGNATIANASSASTSVSGLTQGTYVFRLTVTDDQGATGYDNKVVFVNSSSVNTSPTANAGVDQAITLPTNSATLGGLGSDLDGTIASYAWTKISGGTATFINASSASTSVSGLTQGTYVFRLTVTDDQGATGQDTMTIVVSSVAPSNQPPIANAGADTTITLPTSSVILSGSGSDPDGTIASYSWVKVSGGTATIANPNSASTNITSLTQGSYTFRLTVTDNLGATSADDKLVTVNPAPVSNQSPTANAGIDQTITLPTSSATLSGSGTDSDGTITSYTWTKVSGGTATIANASSASTSVTGLVQGSYTFRLTVTDNQGATGFDDKIVTVNPAPVSNSSPTANAGIDQTITLPTSSATLAGSGADSDGTIASYVWTKVSGGTATFSNASSASTSVTGLAQGTYVFRLTVTDNQGATAQDTMNLIVNPSAASGYTIAQVVTHNTPSNCWIIISAKVYSVASYVNSHPGGVSRITSRCGTDVSTVFNSSSGGGHNHSNYARSLLPTYFMGNLVP
ncbi:MAG: hypothetical protein RL641_351 [Candidatus Parcubacteria bacterium]|jgi:cytochrome b involved in lipid metabolism